MGAASIASRTKLKRPFCAAGEIQTAVVPGGAMANPSARPSTGPGRTAQPISCVPRRKLSSGREGQS